MTRKSYVQIEGVLYVKGTEPVDSSTRRGPAVMGDLPDFISPIDGSVVHGRAGMRDHCARHNVVPTSDLKGLPFKQAVQDYVPDRASIRESIKRAMIEKGYWNA